MDRFTIVIDDDELATNFRLEAVKQRKRLNRAFKEAMQLWLANIAER